MVGELVLKGFDLFISLICFFLSLLALICFWIPNIRKVVFIFNVEFERREGVCSAVLCI